MSATDDASLPPRSEWSHISMWLFLSFLQSLLEMSLPQKASSDGFGCSPIAFVCVGEEEGVLDKTG